MYKKNPQSRLKHLDFMLLDLICLQISFNVGYWMRNGFSNPYTSSLYLNTAIVFTLLSVAVAVFLETYTEVLNRSVYQEFSMTFKHVLLVELSFSFYLFSIQDAEEYSRLTLYYMGIVYFILSYLSRLAYKAFLKSGRSRGGRRSLVIVTCDALAETTVQNIKNIHDTFSVNGIAILDKDRKGDVIKGVEVIANASTLIDYVCNEWVDEVFFNFKRGSDKYEELMEQISQMGVVVHIRLAKENELIEGRKQFVEKMGDYAVLTTSINYASARQLFFKRVVDIAGSLVGIFITGILFLIVAPIIKKQSPGPVFFSQIRVGRNGKKFRIYKFRSMYMDAEERKKELMKQNKIKDDKMFKLDFDPRIIGNEILPDGTQKRGFMDFCRRHSIDEFPQFINVLKGDMSLVGTRPPTEEEVKLYSFRHHARLAAKPGITGMWQVSGRSNITDFEEVVKLDIKYISEWSMALDFKILIKTIGVVVGSVGAM